MNDHTNSTYLKRIHTAIDYIENNLDKVLSLDTISKKAFYSPFHFHRLFKLITGETLNEFINRKRVEKIAAILLVGTSETINEMAYRYGFSSGNAFSRAFKNFYGVPPSMFKSEKNISKIGVDQAAIEKYICRIDNSLNWIKMNGNIALKKLKEIPLVGLSHMGDLDKIGESYHKLGTWMASKNLMDAPNVKAITLYHDNPRVTDFSKVRWSTCFTANKNTPIEAPIQRIIIEKGYYAVGRFVIPANDFRQAWDSMCLWVLENDYEFKDGHYFEVYHNDHTNHPERKFIVDICIPVKTPPSNLIKKEEQRIDSNLGHYREQIKEGVLQYDYNTLLSHIKKLRTYLKKEYAPNYKVGNLYQGSMDFSYFPFTPVTLKSQKLKIVIIFNHSKMRFEICLAGRNRQVQKQYWTLFKDSDWNAYHIPDNLEGFSIVDHILVRCPDFSDFDTLRQQIEQETLKFITDIIEVLEL